VFVVRPQADERDATSRLNGARGRSMLRRMGSAEVGNRTRLAVARAFPNDESGRPLVVVVVQASYAITAGRALALADDQIEPSLAGEPFGADPAEAGWRVEPLTAFVKPATDVVLLGHASPPRPVAEHFVSLRVGALSKALRVVGDRVWTRRGGAPQPSPAAPFERMRLSYDRAFGGWDRSSADPSQHARFAENPVGVGFRAPRSPFEEGAPLPNIEDPAAPATRFGEPVAPAGVAFVSPDWQPRAALAGTFDDAWSRERRPLLPRDFDRRYFNAASRGLVAKGHLRGDEPVAVDGASPTGPLAFSLPGAPAPRCRVALTHARIDLALALDTVIVDTDRAVVLLSYRGFTALRDGPHDVRSIEITGGGAAAEQGSSA
jgi:hypothetical protein